MPLTARLRDEENERINNILKKLIGMDYVPENGNVFIDAVLSGINLNMQQLLGLNPHEMVSYLKGHHFDWANAERFADILVQLSGKLPEPQFGLKEKAVAVYSYIQSESKTFSFDIFNKTNALK